MIETYWKWKDLSLCINDKILIELKEQNSNFSNINDKDNTTIYRASYKTQKDMEEILKIDQQIFFTDIPQPQHTLGTSPHTITECQFDRTYLLYKYQQRQESRYGSNYIYYEIPEKGIIHDLVQDIVCPYPTQIGELQVAFVSFIFYSFFFFYLII